MARHHLPALFRCRRDLLRFRDGYDDRDPLRKWYNLESYITMRHMENMAKVMLGTELIVGVWLQHGSLYGLV